MINIHKLNNVRDKREINKLEIYKLVLEKCYNKIDNYSDKGHGYCFYIVPEYIFGIPRYDTLQCSNFLIKVLKQAGFIIKYTYPNLIFILWEHIPSEIKNNVLSLTNNDNKDNKDNSDKKDYRVIEDYKSSKGFLNKIK
jgi:hypothetical protein